MGIQHFKIFGLQPKQNYDIPVFIVHQHYGFPAVHGNQVGMPEKQGIFVCKCGRVYMQLVQQFLCALD
jgi:hypothetical protein